MILDSGVYRAGVRRELPTGPVSAAKALSEDPDCIAWVDLYEPEDDEIALVGQLFSLHELAVEDARTAHQRPKIEQYDDSLVVVLRTAWYVDQAAAVETGQVTLFVAERSVVTIWHGAKDQLERSRSNLGTRPAVLAQGPSAVLWSVCDTVVDAYEDVARSLQQDVDEIESAVFASHYASEAERIYLLKREVLEIRRAVVPLRDPLERFSSSGQYFSPAAAPYFRNVADHTIRVCEQTATIEILLDSALTAHTARVSVQQNDDMRRISAWVAIAAGPTVVSGIFGMNFDILPMTHWRLGFAAVMVCVLAVCLGLFAAFRRSRWL